MNTKVHFQAAGHHTVTPSLTIKGAAQAIDFYQKAFGAREVNRMATPSGTIMHAQIQIGDSLIMLADEFPNWDVLSPKSIGGTAVTLFVYVEDVDATMRQAIAAGGKELMPVSDQFWGDRSGKIEDPFGHRWHLATHTEDVSPEEIDKRAKAWMAEE